MYNVPKLRKKILGGGKLKFMGRGASLVLTWIEGGGKLPSLKCNFTIATNFLSSFSPIQT